LAAEPRRERSSRGARWSSVVAFAAALAGAGATLGCGTQEASSAGDASYGDVDISAFDLCDAFTGAGTSCPRAGPLRCFAFCDGGCSCGATAEGARWTCVTDLSCTPACAPLDALDGACAVPDAAPAEDDDASD